MSLQKTATSGVRWSTVSMLGTTIMETVRLVVLGRLLSPDVFGIMAMILIIIGFGQVFSQMGLIQAVIQRPEPRAHELASLYWLNLTSGLFVYVLLLFSIPLVVRLYSSPTLNQLIPYVGLLFVLNPLGDMYRAMLQKKLHFKHLAEIELAGSFIGMVVSITFAYMGFGVWSLIWGQLTMAVSRNLGFFFLGKNLFRPRFHFAKSDLQGYLSFGLHQTGAMLLNYISSRGPQFIIGVLLGPQALGYYSMAFNLIMQPIHKINPILTRVAFPVLVQVQNDNKRMKRGYFKMLNILTIINAPLLIGLAVISPVAIPIILGPEWNAIIPIVKILSLYSLVRSLLSAGGNIILAKGRADISLYWNILSFCLIPVTVFAAGYYGDLLTITWAMLVLQTALLFLWYPLIVRKLLGSCFKDYFTAFGTPMMFALGMGCIVLLFSHVYSPPPTMLLLMLQFLLGMLSYIGLYALFDRNTIHDQLRLLFLNRT